MKKEDLISKNIIRCAIEVHKTLGGPGLLDSVYEEALTWELKQNHKVDRQVELPIIYKGQSIGNPLRIDLIVDESVIVECKAISEYH
ncbi:MAG: GxxExxY protein, partial [Candidatus Marinimicrobia bacterium]|nr:GxxExxY protein [Candidatus Neomarinimicrobiota bacterium]